MNLPIDERVKAFLDVRDKPFCFNFDDRRQDGSSYTKAMNFCANMNNGGLRSRVVCCFFDWTQQEIFPSALTAKMSAPRSCHFFTQVFIPETQAYAYVDVTWDKGLSKAGFRVAMWDGLHSTPLAVDRPVILSVDRSEEIVATLSKLSGQEWRDLKDVRENFYRRVSSWVSAQRLGLKGYHA